MKNNIIVVGAGASGLMTASYLAYRLMSMGFTDLPQITILERNDKAGRKLLATGNGRCNMTNTKLTSDCYFTDNYSLLSSILDTYSNESFLSFATNVLGLSYVDLNEWIYPSTLRSETVLKAFILFLKENNVSIITGCNVKRIVKQGNYIIETDNDTYSADYVVMATGGASYPQLGTDGTGYKISVINDSDLSKPMPALVPLKSSDEDIKKLSGIRLPVSISINNDISEKGELLFTDYGISGICVMQISGYCNSYVRDNGKYPKVILNLLPDYTEDELREIIIKHIDLFPNRSLSDCFSGFIRSEITDIVVNRSRITCSSAKELRASDIKRLVKSYQSFELRITGSLDFSHSQVTRGGINLSSLSSDLMYSNGIYYVGEVLNVDGKCGGYNLQWAWSSAMKVADAISSKYE